MSKERMPWIRKSSHTCLFDHSPTASGTSHDFLRLLQDKSISHLLLYDHRTKRGKRGSWLLVCRTEYSSANSVTRLPHMAMYLGVISGETVTKVSFEGNPDWMARSITCCELENKAASL
jgi:hypothetical protein